MNHGPLSVGHVFNEKKAVTARVEHSPFGSFQRTLQVDVEVADREGVDVSVLEGIQGSVRRCVD